MAEPRKVTARGRVRWQITLDVDPYPDGRRRQQTRTFDTRKAALAWEAEVRDGRARGARTAVERATVDTIVGDYLRVACRDAAPATARSYRYLLGLVTARLGHRKAATVTRADIEDLVDELRESGARRGGLRNSTIKQVLIMTRAAWNMAIDAGAWRRNPAERVRVDRDTPRQRQWSAAQARAFLAHVRGRPGGDGGGAVVPAVLRAAPGRGARRALVRRRLHQLPRARLRARADPDPPQPDPGRRAGGRARS